MKTAVFLFGMVLSSVAFSGDGAKGSCAIYPNNRFERSEQFELLMNSPQEIKITDQISLSLNLKTGCSSRCWSELEVKAKIGDSSVKISGDSKETQSMEIEHEGKLVVVQCGLDSAQ